MASEAASHGYDHAAQAYADSRPAYPGAAVDALIEHFALSTGDHVVDLGAGTGIFSHQLADRGLRVTAIEPSASMRAEITASDRVMPHAADAESTGLPDRCADAVVAATAWHWFDAGLAIEEARRLLEIGEGGLGLLWNLYDESVAWVAEYADITYRRRPAGSPSARGGGWRVPFDGLTGWQPLKESRFTNPQVTTPGRLVDRLLSSSTIANLAPDSQSEVREEAWALLERHGLATQPQITLPYITSLYWTRPAQNT